MENIYRSPDEAYPFLADEPQDLRCDFELLTDELSCQSDAADLVQREAGGGKGSAGADEAADAGIRRNGEPFCASAGL